MIKLQKFIFNPFTENTYLVWDDVSNQSIIIDPGCSDSEEKSQLKQFIIENKLKPKYLINTHCHVDHFAGNAFIKEEFEVDFLASKEDIFLIDAQENQAAMFGLNIKKTPYPDKYLSEDLILQIGETEIKFIFTPGHSPGGYNIYFPDEKICFTGDTLFRDTVGRTDFWRSDHDALIASIKEKLFSLPDDVIIYPGHGEESTIGYEKRYNPFLI